MVAVTAVSQLRDHPPMRRRRHPPLRTALLAGDSRWKTLNPQPSTLNPLLCHATAPCRPRWCSSQASFRAASSSTARMAPSRCRRRPPRPGQPAGHAQMSTGRGCAGCRVHSRPSRHLDPKSHLVTNPTVLQTPPCYKPCLLTNHTCHKPRKAPGGAAVETQLGGHTGPGVDAAEPAAVRHDGAAAKPVPHRRGRAVAPSAGAHSPAAGEHRVWRPGHH